MAATIVLAGDTMLGRSVADRLTEVDPRTLVDPRLVEVTKAADLFLLNLECCVSTRGQRWHAPGKPFFFRAPPQAVDLLTHLGVDCVTLANNHALDYDVEALLDSLGFLADAGIAMVGAGRTRAEARAPGVLRAGDLSVAVLGVADHPSDFAAGPDGPGIAFVDLNRHVPDWLVQTIGELREAADAVLVTPHWGPNMVAEPVPHVRAAARRMVEVGATVVAGHSAHVFHGVQWSRGGSALLYDLGDFLDDYAVHPLLRNDLGLLFQVTLSHDGVERIAALPLELAFCHTRVAQEECYDEIKDRFWRACAALGTAVAEENGWLVVSSSSGKHNRLGY